MEFIKRWSMFLVTGLWLFWKFLFFYVSIGRRAATTEEYFNYVLNAFILTLVFAGIEKYTDTHVGKSLLSTFMSAVFVVQIILENYMLEYLRFMPYSNWEWSLEKAAVDGLTRYTKYGYPGYHWAFFGMFLICIAVIVLRACKPRVVNAVKHLLIRRAEKTKRSVYFAILFDRFVDYLTIPEYLDLKYWYLNEEICFSTISRLYEDEDFKYIEETLDKRYSDYYADEMLYKIKDEVESRVVHDVENFPNDNEFKDGSK